MGIYQRLGLRIRAARKRLGLTQPQLASLLGVSQVTVSQWERGESRPSLEKLEPLAEKIGRPLEFVLGLDSEIEETAPCPEEGPSLPVLSLSGVSSRRRTASERVPVTKEEAGIADAAFIVPDASMEPDFRPGDLVGVKLGAASRPGDLLVVKARGKLLFRRLVDAGRGRFLLQPLNPAYPPLAAARIGVIGAYRWLKRRSGANPLPSG